MSGGEDNDNMSMDNDSGLKNEDPMRVRGSFYVGAGFEQELPQDAKTGR